MTQHTKEPWAVDTDNRDGMEWNNHIVSLKSPHLRICFMAHDGTDENVRGEANARRIVVCVNACAGIDDPELWVAQMRFMDSDHTASLEIIGELTKQRDELLAALKRLEDACDKRASCLSKEAYLVAERCKGMIDALYALDEARSHARAVIAKVKAA